jgi:hypothetical protein
MTIKGYKNVLMVSSFVFLIFFSYYIYLNKREQKIDMVQKNRHRDYTVEETSDNNIKPYSYMQVLQLICNNDNVELTKLEKNNNLNGGIKAEIKVQGDGETLDDLLHNIGSLDSYIRLNRLYIKGEKAVENTILDLEFINVK